MANVAFYVTAQTDRTLWLPTHGNKNVLLKPTIIIVFHHEVETQPDHNQNNRPRPSDLIHFCKTVADDGSYMNVDEPCPVEKKNDEQNFRV